MASSNWFSDRLVELMFAAQRRSNGVARRVTRVNDENWHFLDGGPADAQDTLLLLHGFGASKDHWIRLAGFLTKRFRVIAPDLPGFGDSARHPEWNYALTPQRDRLHAFMQSLDLARFHIAGNSMGGALAALYAHAHADQVATLGLFANAGITPLRENEMRAAVARGENPLLTQSVEDYDRVLEFVTYRKPAIPGLVKRYLAERAVANRDFNTRIFQQCVEDLQQGLEPLLPGIKTPTFILWGRHDRVLDVSCIEVMQPLLPRAEAIVLEDTGHVPQMERPAQTAQHYLAFIDRHR